MRVTLLVFNGLVVVVFVVVFVVTFAAREMVEAKAQGFVAEKTREYAEPLVETAGEALDRAEVRLILGEERVVAARAEIEAFQADPAAFVKGMVGGAELKRPAGRLGKLAETVHAWKEKIRAYFDEVMGRLILDVRIFSGTNVVAGLLALFLAWKSPPGKESKLLLVPSAILLIAVIFQSWVYIDDFSYFKILFNSFLGWGYPVLLLITFLWLCWEYLKVASSRQSASAS